MIPKTSFIFLPSLALETFGIFEKTEDKPSPISSSLVAALAPPFIALIPKPNPGIAPRADNVAKPPLPAASRY